MMILIYQPQFVSGVRARLQKAAHSITLIFSQRDVKVIEAQQVTCSEVLSHVQSVFTASHGISSSGPETCQFTFSPQLIITPTNRK